MDWTWHQNSVDNIKICISDWIHHMGSIVWAQGLTQAVIATSSMEWNGKQCKEYPTATYLTPILVEREREGIIVYKGTSHSSKHKSPKIICSSEVIFFSWFDTRTSFKDLNLVNSTLCGLKWQRTYRGSSIYVGWMRSTLVYHNSLSPILATPCIWPILYKCQGPWS